MRSATVLVLSSLRARVIEADEDSVKLDAGLVILSLQRASDYNVTLTGRRDDSSAVMVRCRQ